MKWRPTFPVAPVTRISIKSSRATANIDEERQSTIFCHTKVPGLSSRHVELRGWSSQPPPLLRSIVERRDTAVFPVIGMAEPSSCENCRGRDALSIDPAPMAASEHSSDILLGFD